MQEVSIGFVWVVTVNYPIYLRLLKEPYTPMTGPLSAPSR